MRRQRPRLHLDKAAGLLSLGGLAFLFVVIMLLSGCNSIPTACQATGEQRLMRTEPKIREKPGTCFWNGSSQMCPPPVYELLPARTWREERYECPNGERWVKVK